MRTEEGILQSSPKSTVVLLPVVLLRVSEADSSNGAKLRGDDTSKPTPKIDLPESAPRSTQGFCKPYRHPPTSTPFDLLAVSQQQIRSLQDTDQHRDTVTKSVPFLFMSILLVRRYAPDSNGAWKVDNSGQLCKPLGRPSTLARIHPNIRPSVQDRLLRPYDEVGGVDSFRTK